MDTTVTFADCRRAARAVHATPAGRRAARAARPRFAGGLVRDRAPLSLLLYRAVLDDRMVWLNGGAFAVVEPPITPRVRTRGGDRRRGVRRRTLRLVDGGWPWLVTYGPAAVVFVVGLVAALLLPRTAIQLRALLLVLVVLVTYGFVVTLIASVVRGAAWMYRLAVALNEDDRNQLALDRLQDRHWSIRIYHARAHGAAHALRDAVAAFVEDRPLEGAGAGREPILCRASAVTTDAARAALSSDPLVRGLFEGAQHTYVFTREGRAAPLRNPFARRVRPALQLGVFAGSIAIVSIVTAQAVAETEGAACAAAGDCSGRPAGFLPALYWVVSSLVNAEPGGVTAYTWQGRLLGLLMSCVGIVTITWVIAFFLQDAATRARGHAADAVERFNQALRADPPPGHARHVTTIAAVLAGLTLGLLLRRRRDDHAGSGAAAGRRRRR